MAVKTTIDKRCLSVGRWIATNMDTGATEIVVRFGGIERKRRRDKFVRKHAKLCAKAYAANCCWHKGHLDKHGQRLVDKGRRVLDYSDKTTSGDVYHLIMCSYRDLFKPEARRGCTCGYCRRA
jgi:hypothetical protein